MKGHRRKRGKPFPSVDRKSDVRLKKHPSFFTRHAHLTSIVGAIIVFGTFITKDAVRDHLKDLVDSIDQGQNVYMTERYIAMVFSRTTTLQSAIFQVSGIRYGNTNQKVPDVVASEWESLHNAYGKSDKSQMTIDSIRRFGEHLSYSGYINQQCDDLERAHKELSDREPDIDYHLSQWAEFVSHPTKSVVKDPHEEVVGWERDAQVHDLIVEDLAASTWKDAQEDKEEDEQEYRIVSWASYILYTLGWGLALFGRLFGAENLVTTG